ncbi:MAG: MaoC family dehydratase N-terminal domain-containing protein [Gammaproteobacteria bacterium]|nr:MaoC family dehydratase N-terminal domain-containing protein [Gammaproteobacteria bacterium]
MTEAALTYVTEQMLQKKGVWGEDRTSPPVAASDIRRWAIATHWPEQPPPIYWDEAYARTTRWGGLVAPPDFNPFAWPVNRGTMRRTGIPAGKRPDGKPLQGMNGGQTDTYGEPMRPGDLITARTRLLDWEEKEGRLGHTLYTTTEIEWRNQRGALVRRRRAIGIRY